MEVKFWRANPNQDSNIKGFFTVVTNEGFEIKSCKLISGSKGLFVAPPSQKGTDKATGEDKYYDLAWIPKEVQQPLLDMLSSDVELKQDEMPF
tara:strand:+ start:1665 stop:1943 length:279 start_codon:yes stop_codon:yes gene_type:complete